jgi:ABC-type spermidine/putrescine transport system permease subunit I
MSLASATNESRGMAPSGARPTRISLEGTAIRLVTGLWALGVLLPILSLLVISFLRGRGIGFLWTLSLHAYSDILVGFRMEIILRTLRIVAVVTAIEFVLAFPFALWLAKGLRQGWTKSIILVLLVVPFFLSPAARTIVWRSILGREGLVNYVLTASGLVDAPVDWLLFSQFAIHLGLIGPYFPSMVWPLFISISLIDDEWIKASRDLGASAWQTLWLVVVPLAAPGIAAGILFTAIPMLGDNVVSALLGGGRVALLAESFDDLIRAMNFAGAAALASLLVLIILALGTVVLALLRRGGVNGDVFRGMQS